MPDIEQEQRAQCHEAERGRNDQHSAAHPVDQEAEDQRRRGLRHAGRRAQQAKPVAVVAWAEDRERQRAARDRDDAIASAVKDRKQAGTAGGREEGAPSGCMAKASFAETIGW